MTSMGGLVPSLGNLLGGWKDVRQSSHKGLCCCEGFYIEGDKEKPLQDVGVHSIRIDVLN